MNQEESNIYQKAYVKILNFLSFKPRSKKEIVDRLNKYTNSEIVKNQIIENLITDGYLNDRKVVAQFIQSYIASPKARSLVSFKQLLQRKGFSRDVVEEVVSRVPIHNQEENILKEAKKKLKMLGNNPPGIKKRKLKTYLYSKGYSFELINFAMTRLNTPEFND